MKLSNLYNQVVKFGIERDPRSNKSGINSYADTAILYGSPDTEVRKILVGVDIEAGELLLADKVRERQGLDLVISHHPEGKAWAGFYKVMQLQVDMLARLGVPRKAAQELLNERMGEVERRVIANNHMRSVDVARILNIPFMCVHTPADNHVFCFLLELMNKKKPRKLQDIVDILLEIPEYKDAAAESCGPRIISGSPNRAVGKISFEMTGGTEGPKEALDKLYNKGIRTLVCMHLSEEHFKKVKDVNLNVVIAGHISSDNLGLNLILDRVEKEAKERFQTIDCSGFRRIRRF
jgi:hypothetical protein